MTTPAAPDEVEAAYRLLGLVPGQAGDADRKRAFRKVLSDMYRGREGGIDDEARPLIEANAIVEADLARRAQAASPRPASIFDGITVESFTGRRRSEGPRSPGVRVVEVRSRAVRGPGGRIIITPVRGPGD